jgi:hypothetical protein
MGDRHLQPVAAAEDEAVPLEQLYRELEIVGGIG